MTMFYSVIAFKNTTRKEASVVSYEVCPSLEDREGMGGMGFHYGTGR